MADYWKSTEKKFCDFCKCWIANNRASIDFHEKGKRHIGNVEKKIKDIGRKSQKDQKAKDYEARQVKMMEQNAMKSYMNDVYLKADYSSQFVELPEDYAPAEGVAGPSAMPTVQTQADLQAEAKKKIKEQAEMKKMQIQAEKDAMEAAAKRAESYKPLVKLGPGATSTEVLGTEKLRPKNYRFQKKLPNWYEAKTEEGVSYYWNIITKATTYEKPEDGFVSLELQERNKKEDEEKLKKKEQQWQIMKNPLKNPLPECEKPNPYGAWTEVKSAEETEQVDLQLPHNNRFQPVLPVFTEEEIPEIKFKEKVVKSTATAGSSSEPVAFKKRKIQNFRGRQRNDDDDD
ncbi:WW domain-binding protein 4-like isoform X3 [Neocloeon triangulifer]|uniref:WW domain-binding protein 4-like isoform X3 n=1 Tax=Neocloeon triangulifer TaxID=2078957 RepID=UPI00286F00F3|nr:WW domain-binding protein 4-like isoform X3 [Neocloeon triangulifer]